MNIRKSTIRTAMLTGAAGLVFAAVSMQPETVQADDCLLDTNNDGNADTNVDTDNNANSDNVDARLACGTNANATGAFGTAVGSESEATASEATALGNNAVASASDATGLTSYGSAGTANNICRKLSQ